MAVGPTPVLLALLVLLVLAYVGNGWRIRRTKQRTEVLWPGGHVVSPVRRLGVSYARNDAGSYEWHWRCEYCEEEHRVKDRFSDRCVL